jgi:hypothetical protein
MPGPDRSVDSTRAGKEDNATLDGAMARLNEVLGCSGVVEAVVVDPGEIGPRGIQIRTDNGSSIMTLGEVKADKQKNVRTFRQGKMGEDVDILGEKWDPRLVCHDENIVRKVLSEFFSSGDVSRELLS